MYKPYFNRTKEQCYYVEAQHFFFKNMWRIMIVIV